MGRDRQAGLWGGAGRRAEGQCPGGAGASYLEMGSPVEATCLETEAEAEVEECPHWYQIYHCKCGISKQTQTNKQMRTSPSGRSRPGGSPVPTPFPHNSHHMAPQTYHTQLPPLPDSVCPLHYHPTPASSRVCSPTGSLTSTPQHTPGPAS